MVIDKLGNNQSGFSDSQIAQLRKLGAEKPLAPVQELLRECGFSMSTAYAREILRNAARKDKNYRPDLSRESKRIAVDGRVCRMPSPTEAIRLRQASNDNPTLTVPQILDKFNFKMTHPAAYKILGNLVYFDPLYSPPVRCLGRKADDAYMHQRVPAHERQFRCPVCGMGERMNGKAFESPEAAAKCCERLALCKKEWRPDDDEPPNAAELIAGLSVMLATDPPEIDDDTDCDCEESEIPYHSASL